VTCTRSSAIRKSRERAWFAILQGGQRLHVGLNELRGRPEYAHVIRDQTKSVSVVRQAGCSESCRRRSQAQRNLAINAGNVSFDPLQQGTISQGGQLSITAAAISVSGTWNYGGQGASLYGINGLTNTGTITGSSPLTLTTGGTFTNYGQVIGNDVTINGTLSNAAGAVMHAGDSLSLNGSVTNRGTVESAGNLTFNGGGNYDNQYGTTQANGNITLNTGATVYNTVGTITAGGNIGINAGAVINDALQGQTQTSTQLVGASADPDSVTKIVDRSI